MPWARTVALCYTASGDDKYHENGRTSLHCAAMHLDVGHDVLLKMVALGGTRAMCKTMGNDRTPLFHFLEVCSARPRRSDFSDTDVAVRMIDEGGLAALSVCPSSYHTLTGTESCALEVCTRHKHVDLSRVSPRERWTHLGATNPVLVRLLLGGANLVLGRGGTALGHLHWASALFEEIIRLQLPLDNGVASESQIRANNEPQLRGDRDDDDTYCWGEWKFAEGYYWGWPDSPCIEISARAQLALVDIDSMREVRDARIATVAVLQRVHDDQLPLEVIRAIVLGAFPRLSDLPWCRYEEWIDNLPGLGARRPFRVLASLNRAQRIKGSKNAAKDESSESETLAAAAKVDSEAKPKAESSDDDNDDDSDSDSAADDRSELEKPAAAAASKKRPLEHEGSTGAKQTKHG